MLASVPIVVEWLGNFVGMLFAAGMLWFFYRLIRRAWFESSEARRENWLEESPCPDCGYDLRATPDRCPECGWVPPPQTRAPGRIDIERLIATAPLSPIEPRRPEPHEEPVVVYQTDFGLDADALCEHLVARGIGCEVVRREKARVRGGFLVHDQFFDVVIWSGDQEVAMELVVSAAIRTPATNESQSVPTS